MAITGGRFQDAQGLEGELTPKVLAKAIGKLPEGALQKPAEPVEEPEARIPLSSLPQGEVVKQGGYVVETTSPGGKAHHRILMAIEQKEQEIEKADEPEDEEEGEAYYVDPAAPPEHRDRSEKLHNRIREEQNKPEPDTAKIAYWRARLNKLGESFWTKEPHTDGPDFTRPGTQQRKQLDYDHYDIEASAFRPGTVMTNYAASAPWRLCGAKQGQSGAGVCPRGMSPRQLRGCATRLRASQVPSKRPTAAATS
jgi:hypothetical protein